MLEVIGIVLFVLIITMSILCLVFAIREYYRILNKLLRGELKEDQDD